MIRDKHHADDQSFAQKFEVAGENLVQTVRQLMADASVRRIIIRDGQGRQLMSIPMTVAILGGAAAVFIAPLLSAVAVIGGAVTKLRLEVVRDAPGR